MSHATLTASAVLVVVLTLALAREVRLRRALQRLLKKLLSFWRTHDGEKTVAGGDHADNDTTVSDRMR